MNIVEKVKSSAVQQAKRVIAQQPKEPTLEDKIKLLETKVNELEKGSSYGKS